MRDVLHTTVGGHSLWAVPAVHFRLPFAEEVNRLCADPQTRPEAIAVELGPETAAATAAWLKELGVGPGRRTELPCMLGLAKTNRRIRASAKGPAARLQETAGKELTSLPPDTLKELLGYSAVSILFLSATDSIIEAVRCSLELEVPLYGVDLEQTAEARRPRTMLQDPAMASEQVGAYVARNADFAAATRDEEVDHRREVAMVARLKAILASHGRVLFTGGLAHWTVVREGLHDPAVAAAPANTAGEQPTAAFERIVVHPLLAIHHMDAVPQLTALYEQRRIPADVSATRWAVDPISASATLGRILVEAYRRHFAVGVDREQQLDRSLEDWEARPDFEALLVNLCKVEQRLVPHLLALLRVAQGTMTPQFAKALAACLMDHPWARPQDWPELPVLAPVPTPIGRDLRAELVEPDGIRTRPFHYRTVPGQNSRPVEVDVPWHWVDGPSPPPPPPSGSRHTWPPRDYLFSAMGLRAQALASTGRTADNVDPFEGSLMEGIAVKPTLRAHCRGEERVFVRSAARALRRADNDALDLDPIVWLFRPGHHEGARWLLFGSALTEYGRLLGDSSFVARARQAGQEGHLVSQITYGATTPDDERSEPGWPVERYDHHGCTLYWPHHFTYLQDARCAELGGFERNPYHASLGWEDLHATMRERHGVRLDEQDWPTTLVRLAIPFARRAVTVVAPDSYSLAPLVTEEARRRGIDLAVVPLSYFPRQDIAKISVSYMVPVIHAPQGDQYPDHLERLLGERVTANRHLLPDPLLYYGLTPEEIARAKRE